MPHTFPLKCKCGVFPGDKNITDCICRERVLHVMLKVSQGRAPEYSSMFLLAKTGSDPGRSASPLCPAPAHSALTFLSNMLASCAIQ